ncbi:ethanolamine utilization protein EutP (predicted NTPase) [Bradyrhizobium sp. LM4.3]
MTVESSGGAPAATSCGFVALIGAPNVGKSTLVNALVGAKVTIVSRKVQTTRALIRGIVIENNAQIILVDTPGIFLPKRRLDRAMVSTAWSGAHDADLVCVLLDAKAGIDEEAEAILTKVASVKHEKISGHQQGGFGPAREAAGTGAGGQRAHGLREDLHDRGDLRRRRRRPQAYTGRDRAAGAVSLSRRPDVGRADAAACGRDHAREDLSQAAPGIALPVHGRDRQVGGAQGQVGPHRADDLRRAREPAQDRAWRRRRDDQVDWRGLAQGDR